MTGRYATVLALGIAASGLLAACASRGPTPATGDESMESILRSHPGLESVLENAREHRLQAVLGIIEERPGRQPVLVQHGFRLEEEYFYPASTVKLFAAVAALERLEALRDETGLPIGPDTALVYHPLFEGEALAGDDPSNVEGGTITVAHEIRKIFLVSSNEAFNRLYELVGQDGLAASLRSAGLDARIVHRLSEFRTDEEHRRYPRIDFVTPKGTHTLPERSSDPLPPADHPTRMEIGDAYMSGGEKVEEPMDFRTKNYVQLAELQRGLCMVVRPDVDCGGPGFDLSDEERALLVEAMRHFPRESENPVYDPDEYPDDHVKFVLPGVRRVIPETAARIYDKSGQAYGSTTDNAWIVDERTGRSFFLAATLYTNPNGVLNDDDYAYDTVALPFMADIGEAATRWVWGE